MLFDVKRLSVAASLEDVRRCPYDAGFYCIGYERRSRFVASALAANTQQTWGFEYTETRELAFNENLSWAQESGSKRILASNYRMDRDGDFSGHIETAVNRDVAQGAEHRIWVDVSAMDRSLLARVLEILLRCLKPPYTIRLFYAPAAYVKPSFAFSPIRECSPAIPELSGTLGLPGRQISLLVGLGYEYGVALGLIQQIEPDLTYAFMPKGSDERYASAVSKANFKFDFGTPNVRLLSYGVADPVILFDKLLTITADVSSSRSVVVVPNGPKIFAAAAILIGLIRRPHVAVLRASQSGSAPKHHVEASGELISVDLHSK